MNKNFLKNLLIILGLVYLLFSVSRVIYQSYTVNKQVESLKNEISEMRTANKEYKEKLLYYQSPSYREKIARERLGLQKPGEEVMVVLPEERPKDVDENADDKLPNYKKWWNFFFKG